MRPNGEVYVVEGADIVPLPEDPLAVEADAAKCDKLQVWIKCTCTMVLLAVQAEQHDSA